MKINKILFCMLLFPGFAMAATQWAPQNTELNIGYLYAPVTGFLQTPAGGQQGTSSVDRPTLSEVGIKHDNSFDLQLNVNWKTFSVYGGYHYIRLHGDKILAHDLKTHGNNIVAGSRVQTHVMSDWYQLGARYNFDVVPNKMTLSPELEMAYWRFDYGIKHFILDRQYSELTARIGMLSQYCLSSSLNWSVTAATSIPGLNLGIITADTRLTWTILRKPHFVPAIFVGGGYTYIDFKDKQKMPNHIRYQAWPQLMAGVDLQFK